MTFFSEPVVPWHELAEEASIPAQECVGVEAVDELCRTSCGAAVWENCVTESKEMCARCECASQLSSLEVRPRRA